MQFILGLSLLFTIFLVLTKDWVKVCAKVAMIGTFSEFNNQYFTQLIKKQL